MNCNKKACNCKEEIKNCAGRIREKCRCVSTDKYCEIKRLAKWMIFTGVLAILMLCFPPVVWFVLLALGMIVMGIIIFRL